MSKSKLVAPTLIPHGLIIPELHFGPFSQNWCLEITTEIEEFFPIHVGMSIVTKLNGSQGQPRYVCESGEYVSREEDFTSSALNPLYQEIFKNKTKFSGVREF
ncbi:12167_t:CDS:2, partial [Entrophospora sp. SA101]